jgi:hypothetical protein
MSVTTILEFDQQINELSEKLSSMTAERKERVGELDNKIWSTRRLIDEIKDKRQKLNKSLTKHKKAPTCVGTFYFKDGSEFRTYQKTPQQGGTAMSDLLNMIFSKGVPTSCDVNWK